MSDIDDFQGAIDNARNSISCLRAYDAAWDWAQERIEQLEAPFTLTTEPPTEPGWWLIKLPDCMVQPTRVEVGHNGHLWCNGLYISEYRPSAQWGSAPLPIGGSDEV